MICSNAGAAGSWQARWRSVAETSDRWHFSALTEPAPWISKADLEESAKRNSTPRFNRLWRGIWSQGGDALNRADILAAITRTKPVYAPEPDVEYRIGLDLAVRRDRAAMCLLGADRRAQKVHVALVESWAPGPSGTIDLIAVRETVETTGRRFRARVAFDPFQAALLTQELTAAGITCEEVAFVPSNLTQMAVDLMTVFRERKLELYPDDGLINDLQKLSIEERSFSSYKLVAPSDRESGHADRAFALCVALPGAIQAANRPIEDYTMERGDMLMGRIQTYGYSLPGGGWQGFWSAP